MRKSTRQLNKKLLDSLPEKRSDGNVFAGLTYRMGLLCSSLINVKVKDNLTRVIAMSLALLLLLSIVISPIGNMWSLADEPGETHSHSQEDDLKFPSSEGWHEVPGWSSQGDDSTGSESAAETGSGEHGGGSTDNNDITTSAPDSDTSSAPDTDNTDTENTDPEGTQEEDPDEEKPEAAVCICDLMCIEYIYEDDANASYEAWNS